MRNQPRGLLRSVELLYEAALAPEAWPTALKAVVEHFAGGHMIVTARDCDRAGLPFLKTYGVDEKAVLRTAAADLEGTPFGRLPEGVIINRAAFWSDQEFERSAYYNEYIRPMNGFHALSILQAVSDIEANIALCRSKLRGEFEAETVAGFGSLARHVMTALAFQSRLGSARQYCGALERVFDRVASGVILTDAASRPVFVNACAARVLDEADGLSLSMAGLAASSPRATRRLREAIAAVAAQDHARDAQPLAANGQSIASEPTRLSMARPSQRPSLRLALLPVWRLASAIAGAAHARVAIFMTEPDARPFIDEYALAETFGLRRREAAVVALLAAGLSPAEIAAKLEIGLGTVRNYLKSAFHKTDTHSQAALVALARGFAAPIAPQ